VCIASTTPYRLYSSSAWSNTIQAFKDLTFSFIEEFTTLFLKDNTPDALLDHNDKNPIQAFSNIIYGLTLAIDSIELQKLQIMRNANHHHRQMLGTTTPLPTDHNNSRIEKRLSTINQYTCSPTINYTFQKTSVTANFPQTTTLTELIIRWNLSHNIHSQILDKYWTLDTIQQLALDLQQLHEQSMTSLDHPTLDRRIPDTLHQIFDIECQLNTTPIHSAFINFTTMDNNLHLRFNGMIDPQPETKTMYLEEIADPTISMTILNDTIKILNNAQKETNIIMALAHQNGWQSDPEARLIPKHPNIHLIATIPANTVKYITHRHDGNPLRSKKRIPHEINIWLLHTTHTSIKHNLKREHYFSKLKTLKSKTIHNLHHPISKWLHYLYPSTDHPAPTPGRLVKSIECTLKTTARHMQQSLNTEHADEIWTMASQWSKERHFMHLLWKHTRERLLAAHIS